MLPHRAGSEVLYEENTATKGVRRQHIASLLLAIPLSLFQTGTLFSRQSRIDVPYLARSRRNSYLAATDTQLSLG
ncbi:MAG: hypothetical protein AAFY20_16385, partial [Cyanobacteria bacterium J06639_14]